MIKVTDLVNTLKKNSVNFFTGVPDSILKELSIYLNPSKKSKHVIAVNEGSAVSIAIGYYLAKEKLPCVYMQNSGLSNAINPLISIADARVYSIPLVLIIGWRGSPGSKDEPQHKAKGQITKKILDLLKIKYTVLKDNNDLKKFDKIIKFSKNNKTPVACLIENGILKKIINKNKTKKLKNKTINKKIFLESLLKLVPKSTRIISSTGYNSREIMDLRNKKKLTKGRDFYMVGGMGHTSSVALGYSMFTSKKTLCIDGDGSLLMHMGSIKTLSDFANKNLKYFLLNNNAHESVGGQKTNSDKINFSIFSKSLGFKKYYKITDEKNIKKKIKSILSTKNTTFVEVKIDNYKKENLPRPRDLIKIKNLFMK